MSPVFGIGGGEEAAAMHLHETGTGPAVILIHGCPSTTACLGPLALALSGAHRVLVADLPGYGKSPPLAGRYSLERVQAQLEDELLARDVRELVAVGYSAGAYRALALAFSQRVRVRSVVSLAGIAGIDPEARDSFRQFAQLARTGFDFRPTWLGRMTGPGFAERHPEAVADVMNWIDAAPREVLAAELDAFADSEDLRPRLRDLDVPVLARVGEFDQAAPLACSEAIAHGARRGELQVAAGCGHALLYEDEATVDAVVRAVSREERTYAPTGRV